MDCTPPPLVPSVSQHSFLTPDLIQQVKATIIPPITYVQASHDYTTVVSNGLDCCYACKQTIQSSQPVVCQIIEDPSQESTIDTRQLHDNLYYLSMVETELPIVKNRSLRIYHASSACYFQIPARLTASFFNRVILPEFITDRELSEGRMTGDQYKTTHHMSKLLIASSYPDVESLRIHSFAMDSSQTTTTTTSCVIVMPSCVARHLDVRKDACTESQLFGLFQRLSMMDIAISNTITIPAQLQRLKKTITDVFQTYPTLQGNVYAYRNSQNRSNDEHYTIWRLCIRIELEKTAYRAQIFDFFMRTFLHMDTDHPKIMTWQQLLSVEVLPNTNLYRDTFTRQEGFVPGEATHSIHQRKQEWIKRRCTAKNRIQECAASLQSQLGQHVAANPHSVNEIHQNWVNQVDDDQVGFEYRLNTQKIPTHMIDTDNAQVYYYTQPVQQPSSAQHIHCWKYQPASAPPPYVYCPFLYDIETWDIHKKDMQSTGFIEQPLESAVLLYPSTT